MSDKVSAVFQFIDELLFHVTRSIRWDSDHVILLNDDYTPMDFVIEILKVFFGMTHDRATQVMLHVHTKGKGVCGVFTFEIAETKVAQVNEYSRQNEHPLKCTLEKT